MGCGTSKENQAEENQVESKETEVGPSMAAESDAAPAVATATEDTPAAGGDAVPASAEGKAPATAATPSYEGDIIEISSLVRNVEKNRAAIDAILDAEGGGGKAPAVACKAILATLGALYQLDCPGWNELKERSFVSFVKTTATTNTSVTSGIASQLLQPGERIGILNCGTGAMKFQFYTKDDTGVTRVVEDLKPKDAVSFSSLAIDEDYNVKMKNDPVSTPQFVERIQKYLPPKEELRDVKVVAVITGTLRLAWEAAEPERKEVFESCVRAVFDDMGVTPWNHKSFFISQEDEGRHESMATSNLVKDVNSSFDVLLTCGIGKGTCQWATSTQTTKHRFGMTDPDNLVGPDQSLQLTVLEQFNDPTYIESLVDAAKKFEKPVIALKSGCLLTLTNSKNQTLKSLVVHGV